jgi:hypothetical protein
MGNQINAYDTLEYHFVLDGRSIKNKDIHRSIRKKFMRSGCNNLYLDIPKKYIVEILPILANAFYYKSIFCKFGETLRDPIE